MDESLVLTDSGRLPGASDWEDGSTGRAQSGFASFIASEQQPIDLVRFADEVLCSQPD
jgi:hypothetical protein